MYETATQYCGVVNLNGGDGSMIFLLSWPKLWHYISTQDLSKAMINTENDSVWYQLGSCYMSTARGPGSGGRCRHWGQTTRQPNERMGDYSGTKTFLLRLFSVIFRKFTS